MIHFLKSITNQTFFKLRSKLKWTRRIYQETPCDQIDFDLYPQYQERHSELNQKYSAKFESNYNLAHSLENYFYLDLLDAISTELALKPNYPTSLVDIGAKNFCYLPSLKVFFKPSTVTGIELDAYRLYDSMHTRYSYAQFFCNKNQASEFLVMDFLDYQKTTKLSTCFYPYVANTPLLAGGLSLKQYQPKLFFNHIDQLLKANGYLWMINQGMAEFELAKKYLQTTTLKQVGTEMSYSSVFFNKPLPAVLSLWEKLA